MMAALYGWVSRVWEVLGEVEADDQTRLRRRVVIQLEHTVMKRLELCCHCVWRD
jgi:hypothetical protein